MEKLPLVILKCDADNDFASYTHEVAKINGIDALSIKGCYYFPALLPETEFLANKNLVGLACTAFKPSVAPAGSVKPFFGTNPISMA
jgi:delta1-piperideine-2-carboxylate reductase